MTLTSHSVTDKGLQRDSNEDCFLSRPEKGLWVIADGMGGHQAGEVASALVTQTLDNHSNLKLENSILNAHQQVLDAVNDGRGRKWMGSTVVSLKSRGLQYQIAWVGDSRAYSWVHDKQGGELKQLTTDHSYVQTLLSSGVIGDTDAALHPNKNIITQCIGAETENSINVESIHGPWLQQQWIIMCSDGLSNELDDAEIVRILNLCESPEQACQQLMNATLKHGGSDNVTIQVIESPVFKPSLLRKILSVLPPVSGYPWIDGLLYGSALASGLLIFYWSVA